MRFGLVHGQPEAVLSFARAPSQGSESTAVGTLEGSDQFSSGGSAVGIRTQEESIAAIVGLD